MSINTANGYISQVVLPPKEEGDIERLYLIKDKDAQDNIKLLQSDLTSLDSELNTLDNKIDNIDIPNISNLVSTDDLTNTVSGLISKKETNDNYVTWSSLLTYYPNNATLKNNYAHITDGIIDNATINHEDVNGLSENYAHIAQGKIINAVIDYNNVDGLNENYAHITDGIINNATINYADINDLNDHYASISNGIIDNASIDYTKINNLNDNYAHITNGSIDNATISHQKIEDLDNNYAHIVNGIIDNANIDYANVNNLNTNYAHITDGVIDNANIDYAKVNNLNANYAHIANGVIDNATIDQAKVNNLDANYAHIQNGIIDNANIDQANINNLDANYAHITNGTIDNANISYANVSNLNAHYAHLEDGVIDNALIGYANVDQLESHYAEIDMANVNNAWIENGVIKDAAISDAKILGVSANKLTAGKIDAANINVINLRADNLIVTKINGQPVIGGYTLVDPAISGYADKNPSQEKWYEFYNNLYTLTVDTVVDPNKNYYTTSDSVELYDQATIDGMLDNINARIDSQIETWTVDELPTLNNYPANQWDTNELKNTHIGDICYVVNAADDYNGYTYRFAYDNKSQQYSWILIQDNDTAATLGRLTQLEEFNNQLVHWEDATDEGVTTVRGRFTELSGRIDKVVKSSIQLWHTAEDTTLPNKPTSAITSVSTEGNIWTSVVPIYNANYPYYFYCWQYQYEDESYDWSAVVYDQATTEAQERARTGIANAATAQSTAENNIRSNVQLWFTKKDKEEFPSKPTSQVTNNSATGNTSYNRWNLVVPTYNVGYPYYFYCYQQQKGDGTYQWTDVVYDDITSAAMETARSAISTFETFEQTTFKEVTDTIDTQGTTITQLQTATEKALSQGIEYIVGTHGTTATSNWTGVTQEEQLYTGKQIAYYMTSAGVNNAPATLTLKLSDDTWTNPIKVKINNTDVTNQYPKDTVIKLTYDGGAWKSDNYNSDTNYYDREAYKASVTANGAISTGRIGVFGTDGKLKLLSNSAFDTSYPILYIGTAYTTNALTQTNNYTFWGTPFNLTNTHAITGAAAGKPVYIVGALNGNIMTPTSEVLTCTEPTEENGLFYLRLGLMSTTSNAVLESQHPIYAFMDGKFQQTTQSVVTVSNTVNTVKQTADTNSAKISNLTQTLGTNADGTTAANDIVHQISEIDQNLDGISTRVSKTEISLKGTFATSSTAANTKAKTATIFPENNDFELYTGATIAVKFTNNNTASAPTLKINSTEAKPIKTYSGANLSEAEYKWDAGSTMNFVYDGTNWRIQDSTELTRLKNNESRITQTVDSITSLVANNETYTAPDGTTKTNTIRSAIKQNADNIDLRVEKANVIASINASVETDGTSAVKISADKVNIEGAAIFNSGRLSTTSLNNAYDSKGSASAAQTAAINAAAADATQKANDAQSAAEATASADATEKANAARDAAISAAATDATNKVNAVNKQEQLIYIQAVSGTLSIPDNKKPTAWVTSVAESVSSDEAGLTPVWTTKRPTYRSKYPVLFVATQRQTVGGTLTCTTPLKDDTTTIIDGGHITTGTIDATKVNVTNIDASKITTGTLAANRIESKSLTVDKFTDEDQADILNSHIGQPNLSPFFSHSVSDVYSADNPDGYWHNSISTSYITELNDGWAHIKVSNTGTSNAYANCFVVNSSIPESFKPSTKYTFLVETRNVTKSGTITVFATHNFTSQIHAFTASAYFTLSGDENKYLSATSVSDWSSAALFTRGYVQVPGGASVEMDIRISLYEGEYSGPYKPYVDQTLSSRVKTAETAIEQNAEDITLRATKADVQSLGGNLLTDTDNPVLGSNIAPKYSVVSGGNGTGTIATVTDSPLPNFKKSFRITGNTSGNRDFAQSVGIVYGQKYLFTAYARGIGGNATALIRVFSGSELFTYTIVIGTDWTPIRTIVTLTGAGSSAYYYFQFGLTGAGSIEYIAPCLSGGAAANTAAELKVANDNINLKVSKNDVINQINVSTEGAKIQASRVEIDGTAVFNAAKSKLDAAYDAKGAASAVQNKLDNLEIGGRNLLLGTSSEWSDWVTPTPNTDNVTTYWYITNNDELLSWPKQGQSVAFSMEIEFSDVTTSSSGAFRVYSQDCFKTSSGGKADGGSNTDWNTGAANRAMDLTTAPSNGVQTFSKTAVFASAHTTRYALVFSIRANYWGSGKYRIRKVKYELGNKVTDWSPAPEDQMAYVDAIQVGGRNLFKSTTAAQKAGSGAMTISAYDPTYHGRTVNVTSITPVLRLINIIPETNVPYTISFTCTASATCRMSIDIMDNVVQSFDIPVGTSKVVYTSTPYRAVDSTYHFIDIQFGAVGTYKLEDIMVEQATKASSWSPAPEDVDAAISAAQTTANAAAPKANAVKRTQRIWYRTNGSSAPATPGTASSNWVTKADDGNDAWTKMHVAITSTHKRIYTCEQYEMANGTVGYTSVLLDNTITVIDGGNIITGSVTANKLNAANINASKTLTVGAMTDAAASTILNSNVQVGGRNLLRLTQSPQVSSTAWSYTAVPMSINGWTRYANAVTLERKDNGIKATHNTSSANDGFAVPLVAYNAVTGGESLSVSFEYRTNMTSIGTPYLLATTNEGGTTGNTSLGHSVSVTKSETEWAKFSAVWTFPTATNKVYAFLLLTYVATSGGWIEIKDGTLKLEKGNKATDWTPAPEDMATSSSVDQTYIQNLTPYFLTDMTKTSDEYWANLTYERFTRLGDGWAHFEYTNSGSSTVNNYIKPKVLDFLEPGGKYTLLIEFKNVSISKDGGTFYSQQGSDLQVWGDSSYCGFSIPNATIRALSGGAGTFYRTLTLLTADNKDPSGTVRGNLPKTSFMSINSQVAAGQTVSYDLRLSLYEDGYTGPYKPYSGDQLYATNSALAGTNESLEDAITDIGELSDQLVDTTTEQNKTITTIQTYLNSLRQDLDTEIQSRQKWLNFDTAEGLVIGAKNSKFKTVTTNTSQEFRSGDTVLAETSGTEFVAPVMRSDQLLIGSWMWTRRDNGNLSLKWIG